MYLLVIVGICVGSLVGLIAYTSVSSFDRERARTTQSLGAAAHLASAGLASQIASLPQFLEAIAVEPGVAGFDPATCNATVAGYRSFGKGDVSLVTPNGGVMCSSEPKLLALDHPFARLPGLGSVVVEGHAITGTVVRDPTTHRPAFVLAIPIRGPAGQPAALVALLDPAFLSLGGDAPLQIPHLQLLVVDSSRTVVLSASGKDQRYIGVSLVGHPLGRPIAGATASGPDGVKRIYVDATVRGVNWHVVAGIPVALALADANAQLRRSIELGLATIAMVLMLGLLLQRRLARPMQRLTKAIETTRATDTALAPVEGPTELAELAEAFNDMLVERRAVEAHLAHQARHDSLTGLPNRAFVLEHLRDTLTGAEPLDTMIAVFFLDLDRFKLINDTYGHAVGDELLVRLGRRLEHAMQGSALVGRFGGDEFLVVASGPVIDVRDVAVRLTNTLRAPFTVGHQEIFLAGSIGAAVRSPGHTAEDLLRDADSAMYAAKETGGGWLLFDERMRTRAQRRLEVENGLRRAIELDQFVLHYQPIVDLATGRVSGFEALIRWNHPEHGLMMPSEFIEVAEQTGLIVPIGAWVLETACRQLVAWQHSRRSLHREAELTLHVNLSARQLADPTLPDQVARVLAVTGIHPAALCLEITETVLTQNIEPAVAALHALHAQGVRLSIDDFGTGYSTLTYLRRFPVDALKIDQSFVDGLGRDHDDSAIVEAVIKLAHALSLTAVAEGIEQPHQLELLNQMGCDAGQGYLFGRPLPVEALGDHPADDLTIYVTQPT